MNYYRRYIGDYGRDTALLSLAEHGAYALLLDHYYASEGPLPLDIEDLYRVARTIRPEEKKAVDRVLAQFFRREPDGFHNSRADAEIVRAKPGIEAAKRNGAKGGRPPKENPTGYGDESQRDSNTENPLGLDLEPNGIAIRAGDPTTNHQPPPTNLQKSEKPIRAKNPLPPGFVKFWDAWPKSNRKVDKALCVKRWKSHGCEEIADEIVADVEAKKGTKPWREGFDPAPSKYLNGRRWEDGPPDAGPAVRKLAL